MENLNKHYENAQTRSHHCEKKILSNEKNSNNKDKVKRNKITQRN